MNLTISLDLLAAEFFYVVPQKPVSTLPLIYLTVLAEKNQVAYNLENQAKLSRPLERSLRRALQEISLKEADYLKILDHDEIVTPQQHLTYQTKLVENLLAELQEIPVIRMELAGSWPVFQTVAGRLDLSEEE